MEDKKWFQSKTIWGAVASGVAVVVMAFAEYSGFDVSQWIQTVSVILGVFGIPFTIYGRTKAIGSIK